jgi:two-component system, sensor histidine kinase PdtaS
VLNELMQNAADHAYPRVDDETVAGLVRIVLARHAGELTVDVIDDGIGLPAGFSLDRSSGLGLSIVHTLVTSELAGSIEMRDEDGTRVTVRVPLRREPTADLY